MDRFCATLAAGLNSYGAAPCLDFERTWYSGNDITGYITAQSAARRCRRAGRDPAVMSSAQA